MFVNFLFQSPVEEDEIHCSDDNNSDEEIRAAYQDQVQDIFARFKAQQAQESFASENGTKSADDDEMDDLKSEEQSQRDVLLAMQRHAIQMATAAAAGSGIPNATHFANLAALGGFGSQLNAMSLFANGAFGAAAATGGGGTGGSAGANLSPPMGSIASQNASNQMTPTATNNNGTTLSTLEAGKGYTFEEQFKQVSSHFYFFFLVFFLLSVFFFSCFHSPSSSFTSFFSYFSSFTIFFSPTFLIAQTFVTPLSVSPKNIIALHLSTPNTGTQICLCFFGVTVRFC